MNNCCCAFGHSDFYANISESLYCATRSLIVERNVNVFLTGGMGDFDALFCGAVRKLKTDYKQVKLILVKPYFSNELNTNRKYYELCFDDVIIPDKLMGCHYKSAIQKRNRWMVDESQYVISGIYRDFGGAYQTIQYALRERKNVIDLIKK